MSTKNIFPVLSKDGWWYHAIIRSGIVYLLDRIGRAGSRMRP